MPEAEFLAKLAEHEDLRTTYRNQIGYKVLSYNELFGIDGAAKETLDRLASRERN